MNGSLLISTHCDDVPFSIGSYIQSLENAICVSPMDGIPDDERGKKKHTILNEEHRVACDVLGMRIVSGNFFDDVYHETRDLSNLTDWFARVIDVFDGYDIYVPLGIHHPDHILVRDIFIRNFRIDYFYAELPYRIRYPYLSENLRMLLLSGRKLIAIPPNAKKEEAVRKYTSQIDEQVVRDVMVEEHIWQ